MIAPFHRSYLRNPWLVAMLVLCAVGAWCDAVREMRETADRARFSRQLSHNLSQLQTACDTIAANRTVK